jgi:hypothetical protein
VGLEGGEIIDHTFLRGLLLLLVWMICYILLKVILYRMGQRKTSPEKGS